MGECWIPSGEVPRGSVRWELMTNLKLSSDYEPFPSQIVYHMLQDCKAHNIFIIQHNFLLFFGNKCNFLAIENVSIFDILCWGSYLWLEIRDFWCKKFAAGGFISNLKTSKCLSRRILISITWRCGILSGNTLRCSSQWSCMKGE